IRAALTGLIPAFLHAKPKHFYYLIFVVYFEF
ncbi:hypothetical protein, partial [Acinetobacter sp. 1475718]